MRRRRLGGTPLAVAVGVLVGACGSDDVSLPTPGDPPGLKSIVQLGDSIASGEGTLYGFTYDPNTKTWTGNNPNVKWPGPYPLCHVSPDAYGEVVAKEVEAELAQFACTGATFANGISAAEISQRVHLEHDAAAGRVRELGHATGPQRRV